jgi:hypothetical protein
LFFRRRIATFGQISAGENQELVRLVVTLKEERKMKAKSAWLSFGIVFLLTILFVPVSLNAQELRGKITGRVKDPNGAVVAGASVKVIDVARNTSVALTTNAEGLFDAPYLSPGNTR